MKKWVIAIWKCLMTTKILVQISFSKSIHISGCRYDLMSRVNVRGTYLWWVPLCLRDICLHLPALILLDFWLSLCKEPGTYEHNPRWLKSLTLCKISYKGNTFSSVNLRSWKLTWLWLYACNFLYIAWSCQTNWILWLLWNSFLKSNVWTCSCLSSKACLPYLKDASNPHILNITVPLNMRHEWFKDNIGMWILIFVLFFFLFEVKCLQTNYLDIFLDVLWCSYSILNIQVWNDLVCSWHVTRIQEWWDSSQCIVAQKR